MCIFYYVVVPSDVTVTCHIGANIWSIVVVKVCPRYTGIVAPGYNLVYFQNERPPLPDPAIPGMPST